MPAQPKEYEQVKEREREREPLRDSERSSAALEDKEKLERGRRGYGPPRAVFGVAGALTSFVTKTVHVYFKSG